MDVTSGLFPVSVIIFSWLVFAWFTLKAVLNAPWWHLRDSGAVHVLMGATVAVMLLWMLKGGVTPGLGFHILGVTCLTLMFGWAFAWLSITVVVSVTAMYGLGDMDTIAFNVLFMGGVPIFLTHGLLKIAQQRLPHNFFVYIFVNAFFASGMASIVSKIAIIAMMVLSGAHGFSAISYEYLPYLPLMFLSEALINGMMMTMLVALRPEWVSSFDDASYLNGK